MAKADVAERRKHTYNLVNMNAAQDALLRATKLMAIIDHHSDEERKAIEEAIAAELKLSTYGA